jgi:signal transduction histidine kinase
MDVASRRIVPAAWFAAGIVLAALAAAVLLAAARTVDEQRDAARDAGRATRVAERADDLDRLVGKLRAGASGYLASGRRRFLDPYLQARAALPAARRALAAAVAGMPPQRTTVAGVDGALEAYVEDFLEPVLARARRDLHDARVRLVGGEGERRAETLDAMLTRLSRSASAAADAARAEADARSRRAFRIALAGAGGLAALLFAAGLAAAWRTATLRRSVLGLGETLARHRTELACLRAATPAVERLATRLAGRTRLEQVAAIAMREAGDALGADVGALYVREPDRERAGLAATRGLRPGDLPTAIDPAEGLAGRAFGERRVMRAEYGETAVRVRAYGRVVPVRHELHVPLVHAGEAVGVLTVARVGDRPFSPADEALAGRLAALVAATVAGAIAAGRERPDGELLALLTDELVPPLASIVADLERLVELEGEEAPETKRHLRRQRLSGVERSARRLLRLLGDIRFLEQMRHGEPRVERSEVDLIRVAREAAEVARPRATEREIELRLDLEALPRCAGDPDRLGQALDHLVAHAVGTTPDGGQVRVHVGSQAGRAVIEVSTSERPAGARRRPRRVEPFPRLPGAAPARTPGSDPTLRVVRAIVEAHGGAFSMVREPGAGMTIRIELPLAPPPGDGGREGAVEAGNPGRSHAPPA